MKKVATSPNFVKDLMINSVDDAEFTRCLKITSRTSLRWRKEKKIGFYKIGGRIYYFVDDFYKMIEKRFSEFEKESIIASFERRRRLFI